MAALLSNGIILQKDMEISQQCLIRREAMNLSVITKIVGKLQIGK